MFNSEYLQRKKEKTHRSFSCDFIHDCSQASFIIECFEKTPCECTSLLMCSRIPNDFISNITDCTVSAWFIIWPLKLDVSKMRRSQSNLLTVKSASSRASNSRPWRHVTKIDACNLIMWKKKSTSGALHLQLKAGERGVINCVLMSSSTGETETRPFVAWAIRYRWHKWAMRPKYSHIIRDNSNLQGHSQTQTQREPEPWAQRTPAMKAAACFQCRNSPG